MGFIHAVSGGLCAPFFAKEVASMDIFSFYMPTRLFFCNVAVKKLARARLPKGRGLIITGGTSTTRLGYVAKVQDLSLIHISPHRNCA